MNIDKMYILSMYKGGYVLAYKESESEYREVQTLDKNMTIQELNEYVVNNYNCKKLIIQF